MNKLYYWLIGCLLLSFAACSEGEDGDVYATDLDLDYYVVSSDYDNPIDSLRWVLYDRYGVATYYNDTIGVYDRGEMDREGNSQLYYKQLFPPYTITGWADENMEWTEVDDLELLRPTLEMMINHVFEGFPRILLPKCFLLVEDFSGATSVSSNYYRGLDCAVVSIEGRENTLEAGEILQAEIATESVLEMFSEDLVAFYEVSTALYPDIYGTMLYNLYPEDHPMFPGAGIYDPEEDEPMDLGFLEFGTNYFGDEQTPTSDEDFQDYMQLLLENTQDEVYEQYADYPLVLEKYEIVAALWEELAAMTVAD